jgi:hypothetical protein
MERYQWKNIINPKITFPIVADDFGMVAKLYGMLMPTASATRTVRTVFIIDPEGVIRAMLIYPLTTGRNMMEIMRILMALQAYDNTGNATPADWMPGEPQLVPTPQTLPAASQRTGEEKKGAYACLDWYVCFTQGMIQTMPNSNAPINVAGIANSMPKMPEIINSIQNIAGASNSMPKMPEMVSSVPNVAGVANSMPNVTKMTGNMPNVAGMTGNMPNVARMTGNMPNVAGMTGNMPKLSGMQDIMDMIGAAGLTVQKPMPKMPAAMPSKDVLPAKEANPVASAKE